MSLIGNRGVIDAMLLEEQFWRLWKQAIADGLLVPVVQCPTKVSEIDISGDSAFNIEASTID
jgi:hypothetical protein